MQKYMKKMLALDLYKNKKIRTLPVFFSGIFFLIMIGSFLLKDNIIAGFIVFLNALQFLGCFKILLPLELRESYNKAIDFIEAISQFLIQRY